MKFICDKCGFCFDSDDGHKDIWVSTIIGKSYKVQHYCYECGKQIILIERNSSDIIAQAVREFWRNSIPQPVIAFFYQKYDYEKEWEWHEELITCNGSDDYETVIFESDFCEGQTQVKNIKIVPLNEITSYYANQQRIRK